MKKLQAILSSNGRNITLQFYDWWKKFFNKPVKNDLRTNNIWKILTGEVDDYRTGCLLDYPYFKRYCKLIAIDLSKQQKLDADPKAIKQINFIGNLEEDNAKMFFFILKEQKK